MKKIIRCTPNVQDNSISVTLNYEDGTKRVVKYARFLMETKLGRELTMFDVVVHRDSNSMNFALDNLKLSTKAETVRRFNEKRYSVNTLDKRVEALIGRHQKRTVSRNQKIEIPVKRLSTAPLAAFICGECQKPSQKCKKNLVARQKLGKPAFCSMSCASSYNFKKNPALRASFLAAREKLRLEAEAKRIQNEILALSTKHRIAVAV